MFCIVCVGKVKLTTFKLSNDAVKVTQEEEVASDVDIADDIAVQLKGDFKVAHTLNPAAALHVATRVIAKDELGREIACLNALNCCYIVVI